MQETTWSPSGSRPHVLLQAGPEIYQLQDRYLQQLHGWWQKNYPERNDFAAVFPPVKPQYLHATLAWLDRPTISVSQTELDALYADLLERTAAIEPFELQVGPALVCTHAIQIYVRPETQFTQLATAAYAAMHAVWGIDAPVRVIESPHISLTYCQDAINTETLQSALNKTKDASGQWLKPVSMSVRELIVVDNDTYGPGGLQWNLNTVGTVQFGQANQPAAHGIGSVA